MSARTLAGLPGWRAALEHAVATGWCPLWLALDVSQLDPGGLILECRRDALEHLAAIQVVHGGFRDFTGAQRRAARRTLRRMRRRAIAEELARRRATG